MGQQQLLLVILVTIIVGIATVVAINVFGTAADEANRDAVRQDLLAAATQAQAIWARPTAMGGIGQDFGNLTDLRRLNIPRGSADTFTFSDDLIENDNGDYSFGTGSDATTLVLEGDPSSGGDTIEVTISRETDGDGQAYWDVTWDTAGG